MYKMMANIIKRMVVFLLTFSYKGSLSTLVKSVGKYINNPHLIKKPNSIYSEHLLHFGEL